MTDLSAVYRHAVLHLLDDALGLDPLASDPPPGQAPIQDLPPAAAHTWRSRCLFCRISAGHFIVYQ